MDTAVLLCPADAYIRSTQGRASFSSILTYRWHHLIFNQSRHSGLIHTWCFCECVDQGTLKNEISHQHHCLRDFQVPFYHCWCPDFEWTPHWEHSHSSSASQRLTAFHFWCLSVCNRSTLPSLAKYLGFKRSRDHQRFRMNPASMSRYTIGAYLWFCLENKRKAASRT